MTEPTLALSAAFMIGLLGSTHCMGMCGGISSALALALPVGPYFQWRRLGLLLTYNGARITSYVLIALLLALPGSLAAQSWLGAGEVLRTLSGVLLILMGLAIGQWWSGIYRLERVGNPLWKKLAPVAQRLLPVTRLPQAAALGFLWGWLPCGLVYSALSWAIIQPSLGQTAWVMGGFGLGTLPIMLASGLFATRLQRWRTHPRFRRLSGALLILFGVWTIPATQRVIHTLSLALPLSN